MCDRISSCPRHPEMQKEVTRRRWADRSTGVAPPRGSLEAALIACSEMPTVTGREYHCPHRPSSPCREPSGICGPSGIRSPGWNREIPPQLMAQRPLWLEAMGMCLVNEYGVIKQQSSVFSCCTIILPLISPLLNRPVVRVTHPRCPGTFTRAGFPGVSALG